MKKAVKITNWVFVIGVIVFVLIFIVAKVQAHQSEAILLPESFHGPGTDLLLSLFLFPKVFLRENNLQQLQIQAQLQLFFSLSVPFFHLFIG